MSISMLPGLAIRFPPISPLLMSEMYPFLFFAVQDASVTAEMEHNGIFTSCYPKVCGVVLNVNRSSDSRLAANIDAHPYYSAQISVKLGGASGCSPLGIVKRTSVLPFQL